MATLACRVQFLDDTDPFNSTNFPEPSRPPLFTFREDLALGTQLAGVHRLLRAPHKVRPGGPFGCSPCHGENRRWGAAGRLGGAQSQRHAPERRPPPSPLGRVALGTRRLARDLPGGRARRTAPSSGPEPGRAGLSRCRAGRRRDEEGSPAPRR